MAHKKFSGCMPQRIAGIKKRTRADAAALTEINAVTLSGYEIRKNKPNLEALVRLAGVYEVSLDYLMCRTDEKESSIIKSSSAHQNCAELLLQLFFNFRHQQFRRFPPIFSSQMTKALQHYVLP